MDAIAITEAASAAVGLIVGVGGWIVTTKGKHKDDQAAVNAAGITVFPDMSDRVLEALAKVEQLTTAVGEARQAAAEAKNEARAARDEAAAVRRDLTAAQLEVRDLRTENARLRAENRDLQARVA